MPANQRGLSSGCGEFFNGLHVTQPCGITLAGIPFRDSFDVRNSINSSPPTLSSTPIKTVETVISRHLTLAKALQFSQTTSARLFSPAKPNHKHPCTVVSRS